MRITLPRKFDNFVFERIGKPEELKSLIGIPCISYSQNSSLDYNIHSFIRSYLFGERSENIWMNFGEKPSGKSYSEEDIDLLKTLASQAAIAFENSRLQIERISKQMIEEELLIARRIQMGLLGNRIYFTS